MKDRDYYEQLLSDRLDRELTPTETEDLTRALQEDVSLVAYEKALLRQREILRGLPVMEAELSALDRRSPHRVGLLKRMWRAQVRIPLPAAAAVTLIAAVWIWLGDDAGSPPASEPTDTITAKYVQVERLEPAIAVPASYQIDSTTHDIKEGEI